MPFSFALLILAALAASPALGAVLTVEGVLSPAWVERGGVRQPLQAGMTLRDKDRVQTGSGARVLLRMAEGSAVKLGANAVLTVDGLAERPGLDVRALVMASLDVVRGAFRFTADIFGKRPVGRDVKIRITAITAGIRGTDVWGKSEPQRDVVCLIDGSISVAHAGREFTMAEPLSFFIAPRTGEPAPVARVSREQLSEWAAETEIAAGSGAARRGGRFGVDVSIASDQAAALRDYDALRAAGFPAVIRPEQRDGALAYRVRVPDLASVADARAVAEKLRALGMADAQVAK